MAATALQLTGDAISKGRCSSKGRCISKGRYISKGTSVPSYEEVTSSTKAVAGSTIVANPIVCEMQHSGPPIVPQPWPQLGLLHWLETGEPAAAGFEGFPTQKQLSSSLGTNTSWLFTPCACKVTLVTISGV